MIVRIADEGPIRHYLSAKKFGHGAGHGTPHRPRTIITITAAYDRILEDDEQHAVSDNLAGFLSGERGMITSGRDSAGPYTWQTIVDDAMTVTGWTDRIGYAVRACLPGGPREILAVEVLTMEELMRRAKSRSFGPDAPARPLTDPERARAADIRTNIPRVVSTAAFARMLGCTPARVRQLRARAAAQIEAGRTPEDGFPQEIDPGSGYWLRADAEAYAALPRPTIGRPRTADRELTACSSCGQAIERHQGTGTGWRHVANAPEWCDAKPPRPAAESAS